MVCHPRFWWFLWTEGWFCGVPSTFRGVFVDGRVVLSCVVHVFGCFCGREGGFVVCRPRFGRFCGRECGFVVYRPRLWRFLWLGGLRRRSINDGDFGEG